MRLAIFTSQFPAKVNTFFARDIRGLIESGIDVEIFPIYDLDSTLWKYVPDILNEKILPRERVHHIRLSECLAKMPLYRLRQAALLLSHYLGISRSALRYGAMSWLKSTYVVPKAWYWAQHYAGRFDHVLAYWGNYAGTCAFLFHKLCAEKIPFSIFLHAGTDLYRTPVYLRQKLLYSDRIITCIEFNRKFILKNFDEIADQIQNRIVVSYHGMDFNEFPAHFQKKETKTVLAVGHLAYKKGFADLIRAVGLLHNRKVPVTCEIIGDGEEEAALKQLAAQLGVFAKVKFHGWLPFDQVKEKMREATLLVHPSSELGDGLPNVVKEAMASGTPVIASDIAGIPEGLDFGRCGILTPPQNPQALADQMERLLAHPRLRRDLSRRARIFAQAKFDLWKNGKRLADILRSARRGQPFQDTALIRPLEDDLLSGNTSTEKPELLVNRSEQNISL